MKCSLLSLSTYIDGELSPDRRAELDAHMVGCPRCSAGTATLREEKQRISQLARVRVPSPSAQLMLEQVGITGVTMLRQPQRPTVEPDESHALPWHDTSRRAAALPWAPTRPVIAPAAPVAPAPVGGTAAPPAAPPPHVQPGLPLDEVPVEARTLTGDATPIEAGATVVEEPLAAVDVPELSPVEEEAAFDDMAAYADTVAQEEPATVAEEPAAIDREELAAAHEVPVAAPAEPEDVEVAGVRHHSPPSPMEAEQAWTDPAASAWTEPAQLAADVAEAAEPTGSWETGLPAPLDDEPAPPPWSAPDVVPSALPSATLPAPVGPPHRVVAAGPAALWTRVRDAVAVRFALAGGRAADDSIEIVRGPAPRRGDTATQRITSPSLEDRPAQPGTVLAPEPAPDLPALPGFSHPSAESRHEPADERWDRAAIDDAAATAPLPDEELVPAVRRGRFDAFAASSYTDDDEADGAAAARPLGRHSRAVARDKPTLGARVASAVGALGARLPLGRTRAATTSPRRAPVRPILPARLMPFGVVAVAAVFLAAIVVGRSASPNARATSTATRTVPSAAASQAPPAATSAPATSSPPAASSAPATSAPASAPTAAQTFGSGGTGFQIQRVRFGQQPGFFRTVFDIGAASGTVSGTPRVDLSMPDAKTILLTFGGTLPAGSVGAPGGSAISSLTLVSSGGGKSQYRITLAQPATPNAFYLEGPTRFVLDLR